jgi:hypothetical protein
MPSNDKDSHFASELRQLWDDGVLTSFPAGKELWVLKHKELKLMADTYLGAEYDQKKTSAVIDFQMLLQVGKKRLDQLLDDNEITAEKYYTAFSLLVTETADICEQILGPEDFEKMFGMPAKGAAALISRETFFGASRS